MAPCTQNRWKKNREHWTKNLDAQNLKDSQTQTDDKSLMQLGETEDVRKALLWLKPVGKGMILDLGGGLGVVAILLAKQGAEIVIADLSAPRLKEAHQLAVRAGVGDRVHCVACLGENLPFLCEVFVGETTKSVLIHTELAKTARELERCLKPDGRAAFIEPLSRNPLVNLYRRLAAPKIWQEITDYFTENRVKTVLKPFAKAGYQTKQERLFFLAFLACVFNYLMPIPTLYRVAEKLLLAVDQLILAIFPFLKRHCWFVVMKIKGK